MSTNRASEPPRYSARATAASFPEETISPLRRSLTLTCSPTSMNMLERLLSRARRHAFSLTGTLVSMPMAPFSTASNIRSKVMIFARLAGCIRSCSLKAYRIWPE